MNLLFGYGSLISLESSSKTLGRLLTAKQITEAVLPNYSRTWGAKDKVKLEGTTRALFASFLNLIPNPKANCNGVIFEVSNEELTRFDQREFIYHRTKVAVVADGQELDAITYITKPNDTNVEFVMQSYLDIINQGFTLRTNTFASDFWASTEPLPETILSGSYAFSR